MKNFNVTYQVDSALVEDAIVEDVITIRASSPRQACFIFHSFMSSATILDVEVG